MYLVGVEGEFARCDARKQASFERTKQSCGEFVPMEIEKLSRSVDLASASLLRAARGLVKGASRSRGSLCNGPVGCLQPVKFEPAMRHLS
jgi:hypothetical protein